MPTPSAPPAPPGLPSTGIHQRLLQLTLLILTPLMLLIGHEYYNEIRDLERSGEAQTRTMAHLVATALGTRHHSVHQALDGIQDLLRMVPPESPDCPVMLSAITQANDIINALYIRRSDGHLVCHNHPPFSAIEARNNDPRPLSLPPSLTEHTTAPQQNPLSGRWEVQAWRPLAQNQNQNQSPNQPQADQALALVAIIDIERLLPIARLSQAVGLPDNSLIVVIDADHRLLNRSQDAKRWIGKDMSATIRELTQSIREQGSARHRSPLDGVERIMGQAAIPGTGWQVLVGLAAKPVDNNLRQHLQRLGIIIALLLLLALLARQLHRLVLQPIQEIAATARAIAEGSGQRRVALAKVGQTREFALVASQFNHMLDTQAMLMQRLAGNDLLMRGILSATPDGYWLVDAQGRLLDTNAVYERLSGYRREELLQLQIKDLEASENPEAVAEHIARIVARGSDIFETWHRRKSGALWPAEVTVLPCQGGEGRLIVFIRDLVQHKRAELLARLQRRFSSEAETRSEALLLQSILGAAERYTSSRLGLFHRIAPDGNALCQQVWSEQTSTGACTMAPGAEHQPIEQAGWWAAAIRSKTPQIHETGLEQIDATLTGHPALQRMLTVPLLNAEGAVSALIAVANKPEAYTEADIGLLSELGHMGLALIHEQRAQLARRQADTIFASSQEGLMLTRLDGTVERVNPAFCSITGYSEAEIVGKTPRLLNSGRHDAAFYQAMWQDIDRHGRWQGEIWNKRKNGDIYPQWLTISGVRDAAGNVQHYAATFADISALRRVEERLHYLTHFDPLTGLPSREDLLGSLGRAISAASRSQHHSAVLLIGLDQFKTVNEVRGHAAGDALLIAMGQRLKSTLRIVDTVSRLGSDEFVALIEELGKNVEHAAEHARQIAEKILAATRKPFTVLDEPYFGSVSIGITLFHRAGDTPDEVLQRADVAMQRAKTAGRNTLSFYDPAMQAALEQRVHLEAKLRQALPLQQLRLYYQAQVDRDGQLTGAEALLRWQHPELGLVSPATFIPLAEDSGLILPIGHWVLATACRQLAAWADVPDFCDLVLSVNVSARQFRQPDFIATTQALIVESGINPGRLKLELTESMVVDDMAEATERMRCLQALGVNFSLDDFGTGYSSLAYLRKLPVQQLKIDQSFVRDLEKAENDAAIVRIIISMGQALGLHVIAEGVETAAQRDFLHREGCDAFQGYYFSRPVPLSEFEQLAQGHPGAGQEAAKPLLPGIQQAKRSSPA